MKSNQRLCPSPEATFALGEEFGLRLAQEPLLPRLVTLYGDLGAGKTTFLKGFISAATGLSPEEVTSPTFTTLHLYEGREPLYHFDLYKLVEPKEFFSQGFGEFITEETLCCIEWPERIETWLPKRRWQVHICTLSLDSRIISIQ